MRIILMLLLICVPMALLAQRTESDVLKLLNHGSEKTWLFEGTEIVMKGSDHCDGEGYFLFRSDKKVVIAECFDNEWVVNEENYAVEQSGSSDWHITIGNQKYELIMLEIPAYDEIKLRSFKGGDKVDPALDMKLKYLKDD